MSAEWISWPGGGCPTLPDTRVDVVLENGVEHTAERAGEFDWNMPGGGRITKFRLSRRVPTRTPDTHKEQRQPPEEAARTATAPSDAEYTGGSVGYYKVPVAAPLSGGDPYVAECNDIIEALGMTYAEGNAFKAIWRLCAARTLGVKKRGYTDGLYDAEKVVFFGTRMVAQERGRQGGSA